jgi:hypothetical protein
MTEKFHSKCPALVEHRVNLLRGDPLMYSMSIRGNHPHKHPLTEYPQCRVNASRLADAPARMAQSANGNRYRKKQTRRAEPSEHKSTILSNDRHHPFPWPGSILPAKQHAHAC